MALKLSLSQRTYVPEWEANREKCATEQIRVIYAPLTVEEFFAVQQELQVNLMSPQEGETIEALTKRFAVMRYVVALKVKAWENVELDGEPVTTEQLFAVLHPTQMGLLAEVYGMLLSVATGSEEQAGNLSAPSVPASEGSASPAVSAGGTASTSSATATAAT